MLTISPDIILKCEESTYENSPSGSEAIFVKITKEWGIKLFRGRSAPPTEERDYAYAVQREAAKHGLGPQVGQRVDLDNCTAGYVTQVVAIIDYFNRGENSRRSAFDDMIHERYKGAAHIFCNERDNLIKALKKSIDWAWLDTNYGNMGWLSSGKMVCIDFGRILHNNPFNKDSDDTQYWLDKLENEN